MSGSDVFRVWPHDAVAWGETMCEAPGCLTAAAVLADFDERRREGVPVCIADADVLLERAAAIAELEGSGVRAELSDPWETRRRPARRREAGPSEWEYADRSPEKWLAEQHGVDTSDVDWDIPW